MNVEVGQAADEQVAANDNAADSTPAAPAARLGETLGLTLASLTPDLRQQFGIADDVDGVVVTDVDA